ncbi:MAG: putative transcriptional regulator [Bermanella sp.]|jgi:putative transcriptional regulator
MNIQHHLQPETVMAYAAGTLPAAMALVVGCHTERCKECLQALRSAEALGGLLMQSLAAKPLSESARDNVLAMLDQQSLPERRQEPKSRPIYDDAEGFLPHRLKSLLGIESYTQLKWRKLAPGIAKFNLPLSDGKSFLLRIGAGLAMPLHTHKGSELTLLLQGGYHDKLGSYHMGDVADLDASIEHQPVAFDDEPCICLAGLDAGLRFKGLIPSLLKPLTGL